MAIDFDSAFEALTGNPPFPWQQALYRKFAEGIIPESCNLPTGLGKTSVIAIWLIALANHPDKMPRRLVYVVNRRTVVDQTTTEVEKFRENIESAGLTQRLIELCALPLPKSKEKDAKEETEEPPIAISTLRGQFADNRAWSADPCRPAVICGTVDMIGSRLLFGGYGVGFKSKPLHAGFLGQDALLVHDEAHLEHPFQTLVEAIQQEQERERADVLPWPGLRVMALTATPRGTTPPFELTEEEKSPPDFLPEPSQPIHHVWERTLARKGLQFYTAARNEIAKTIGNMARDRKNSGNSILVFVQTVADAKAVCDILTDEKKRRPCRPNSHVDRNDARP